MYVEIPANNNFDQRLPAALTKLQDTEKPTLITSRALLYTETKVLNPILVKFAGV